MNERFFDFYRIEKKSIVDNRYIIIDSRTILNKIIVTLSFDAIEEVLCVHMIHESLPDIEPVTSSIILNYSQKCDDFSEDVSIYDFLKAIQDYHKDDLTTIKSEIDFPTLLYGDFNQYRSLTKEQLIRCADGKQHVFKTPVTTFHPDLIIENPNHTYEMKSFRMYPSQGLIYKELIEDIENCKNHWYQLLTKNSKEVWEKKKIQSNIFKTYDDYMLNEDFQKIEDCIINAEENGFYDDKIEYAISAGQIAAKELSKGRINAFSESLNPGSSYVEATE